MYVGMIETRSLKISLKSFHENYSELFKKTTRYVSHIVMIFFIFLLGISMKKNAGHEMQ